MSEACDLVVRNAHAISAADAQQCDIGVRGERIVAPADRLGPGRREIDATGRLVLQRGDDSYCERD